MQTPQAGVSWFTRIFFSAFIFIGSIVLCIGIREMYWAMQSMRWPVAEGWIENSSVEYHRGHQGSGTYHAEILYTFAVDGRTHSGNRVAYGDYGSSDPSHAQHIVNRYPKDAIVAVRYLSSAPDFCVLEPGLQAQAFFVPGIGLVFVVSGTLMSIFFPRFHQKQVGVRPAENSSSFANSRHDE